MIIYCGILLGNKKSVLLYIDREIVTEAKEIGLNLSKTCENALKTATKQLKRSDYSENSDVLSTYDSSKIVGAGGGTRTHEDLRHRGLNPAP